MATIVAGVNKFRIFEGTEDECVKYIHLATELNALIKSKDVQKSIILSGSNNGPGSFLSWLDNLQIRG